MEINVFHYDYSEQGVFHHFLASDLHLGHFMFDEELFKREFDAAVEKGATIDINGDIIDLITVRDKRYAPGRNKFHVDAIVNKEIGLAKDMLWPYRDHIRTIGCGNHEVTALKMSSIDATSLIIAFLNQGRSPELPAIKHGGYQGFLRNCYHIRRNQVRTLDVFYNHGQGGASAEVSKGAIDLDRRKHVDADIVWIGHKHKFTIQDLDPTVGLTSGNNLREREKTGLVTGCYLQRFSPAYSIVENGYMSNYAEERFRTLSARGGVMVRVEIGRKGNMEIHYEFSRTKPPEEDTGENAV